MVTLLELHAVHLRHPRSAIAAIAALDGVDFAARSGEVHAVIGPNGAGKSTLLRVAAGLLRADSGRSELLGEDVAKLPPRERARRVAVVPQGLESIPPTTVDAFVAGGRYARRRSRFRDRPEDRAAIDAAHQRCATAQFRDRLLLELSGGERQRALTARALAQDAAVLLCDEPTASLDVDQQIAILEILASEASDGRAVVLVTHDLNLAAQFADRVTLLHEGRVRAQGRTADVLRPALLGPVYGDLLHFDRLPSGAPIVVPDRRKRAPVPATNGAADSARRLGDARVIEGPPGPEVTIAGRRYGYFGGSGYLGIQARPELAVAAADAVRCHGLHTATSRSGYGLSPPLRDAEAAIAAFFGSEAAWLLPSGWAGASVLVHAFGAEHDRLYLDADAHYALRDAAALSGLPVERFAHADPAALRERLRATLRAGERPLVLTDGVFLISGRVAPLDEYADLLRETDGASLLVDDAHGVGVLGEQGHGSVEFRAPRGLRCLLTATTSKALGGYGGLLHGDAAFIARVQAGSRWFEGASPPPTPVAAATAAALRIALREPELRVRLRHNIARLRAGLGALGLDFVDSAAAVLALTFDAAERARALHEALRADGLLVPFFEHYAGVPAGGALRIAVFATHSDEQIDRLLAALRRRL